MTEGEQTSVLCCPISNCDSHRFYSSHDESSVTTLIYHIRKEHEDLYNDLKNKLCASGDSGDAS